MPLKVAVIGSGLGGLAAAISLRREGHHVCIYERFDFAGEVGANISCASNGTRFLEKWGLDIQRAKPFILKNLIWHNFSTGEITASYPFGNYKELFGTHYYSFHRQDIHRELKRTATTEEGDGPPVQLLLNHRAISVDVEKGWIKFENGSEITADLVVAADGSNVRS
jgi:salicylate hydroxylase